MAINDRKSALAFLCGMATVLLVDIAPKYWELMFLCLLLYAFRHALVALVVRLHLDLDMHRLERGLRETLHVEADPRAAFELLVRK